jgi:hypothetical protein
VATVIYSSISYKLANSKYSAHAAIIKMHNLRLKMYESISAIEELTKEQKDIFSHLNLDCPFREENGNLLKKDSPLAAFKPNTRGKGGPKGSKNKNKTAFPVLTTCDSL